MWDTSQFPLLPEALEIQFTLWGALFTGPGRMAVSHPVC